MSDVKHKVFISYYHADQEEVDQFIQTFDKDRKVFISRSVGTSMDQKIFFSEDTDYVVRRIRELYLLDTTITCVMIGKCTWARRYVDWELQSSLRSGETVTPNGLLGIVLPSAGKKNLKFPPRLAANVIRDKDKNDIGYARAIRYPTRKDTLANYLEDAFQARTKRVKLINNPRERFKHNRQCP